MDTISSVKAIKTFFEQDGGAKVSVSELKELDPSERKELGLMCAEALGKEIEKKL